MESEASLAQEKASPLQPKESEPLGAPTRRPPSPVTGLFSCFLSFVVRDAFSYAGVHFHSPTLSSTLSNTETIGSKSQKARRKLEEDTAIEKRTEVNGPTSIRTVHGKTRTCGCVARK